MHSIVWQGLLQLMQTGHETVKLSNPELLQPVGIFDVTAQEAYPRVNNSCTAGEPFFRLNPVWKLLFSCQRARGNSYLPSLPTLPFPHREQSKGSSAPMETHGKEQRFRELLLSFVHNGEKQTFLLAVDDRLYLKPLWTERLGILYHCFKKQYTSLNDHLFCCCWWWFFFFSI